MEKVKPNARGYANVRHNVKTNLSSQKGLPRIDRGKLLDEEKVEPLIKEQRQENRGNTRTDQAARDALFDEFLRWQVHQVLSE